MYNSFMEQLGKTIEIGKSLGNVFWILLAHCVDAALPESPVNMKSFGWRNYDMSRNSASEFKGLDLKPWTVLLNIENFSSSHQCDRDTPFFSKSNYEECYRKRDWQNAIEAKECGPYVVTLLKLEAYKLVVHGKACR